MAHEMSHEMAHEMSHEMANKEQYWAKYIVFEQDDKLLPIVFNADISHSVFKHLKPKSAGEVVIFIERSRGIGWRLDVWPRSVPNSLGLHAICGDIALIRQELITQSNIQYPCDMWRF